MELDVEKRPGPTVESIETITSTAKSAAQDAEFTSSAEAVVLEEENTTRSTRFGRRVVKGVVAVARYAPRRCRYDPEREFHFNLAMNVLFAFAAAFTVANLYYNHPILDVLARDFNVSYEKVSTIPNVMQAGYACGLFFITPLGDIFRRRALTLALILFTTAMWLGCTVTQRFTVFTGLSFVVGATTVTPQLMLPLVGDLAPANRKATAISIVSAGLQLGLLIARVLSGLITQYSSWRSVYWLGFGIQLLIFSLLWLFMPDYPPKNRGLSYPRMLLSMIQLIPKYPLLVQSSLNGLCISATFTLYWTTLTFLLASPPYEFSSSVIGLFGLIGIAAILTTPWIGRYVIDRWHPQLSVILGTAVVLVGQVVGTYAGTRSVAAPVIQAWMIDLGISTAQVANWARIYGLDPSSRNRINSVFMLAVFIGQHEPRMSAVTTTDIKGALPLLARGKVRDVYTLSDSELLFVATDRISAYDVIMENGIPDKGKLLTSISVFWFDYLSSICRNHYVTDSIDRVLEAVPETEKEDVRRQFQDRSMIVRKFKVFPVEAIVRGYIAGSAWSEYKQSGTVHGIRVAEGMQESQEFEKPIYTPSTKAEQGEHDENIHPDKETGWLRELLTVREMIGEEYANKIEQLALALYTKARDYARSRGIIIADTKFEFGLDEGTNEVILVDEVLTPDSSRFWPAASYQVGKSQDSYDKQFLRNWLTEQGLKGKDGVRVSDEIVVQTSEKYKEAYGKLTGKELQ
ncbi:Phosphoribosylaminoimidazole-succinocarboxamide synthase [Drechslerella dactyloides]|uniref:Phosphoribosylaminoimidazole-succinocarboxamide synthase n=1 Tax=Drechslerella dactyloides TaxID=74499 RepID=A0AAD6NM67_DREDA|nr:Phosphoribosylaminoimidazole-succinocarboxamide synthase [Drechslerella dactyloides]